MNLFTTTSITGATWRAESAVRILEEHCPSFDADPIAVDVVSRFVKRWLDGPVVGYGECIVDAPVSAMWRLVSRRDHKKGRWFLALSYRGENPQRVEIARRITVMLTEAGISRS